MRTLRIPSEYEQHTFEYEQPSKKRKYTPDFRLPNGILVETKGRFTAEDRQKHIHFKASNPHLDVRFIFNNPDAPLYKGSPTTYGMWCRKHGFKFARERVSRGKTAVATLSRILKAWADEEEEEPTHKVPPAGGQKEKRMLKGKCVHQKDQVREHLTAGNTITPAKAQTMFGVHRLASVIHKLKQEGLNITSCWLQDAVGRRYSEYRAE